MFLPNSRAGVKELSIVSPEFMSPEFMSPEFSFVSPEFTRNSRFQLRLRLWSSGYLFLGSLL
jgi:hypothetical protein